MTDAVVVGAGPNGLAAAVTLARSGVRVTVLEAGAEIGGGTRSSELTLPGLLHDHCSAVHPSGVGSPFFRSLALEEHGLEWAWPDVDLAHPLDSGEAAVLWRSLSRTAGGLGLDGPAWQRLFGPLAGYFDTLVPEVMAPVPHLPRHPIRYARFGLPAALPATVLARRWRTDKARALFAGAAAHLFTRLDRPLSSSVGMFHLVAGHSVGWPVARGGSRSVTDALAGLLGSLGGTVETGVRVTSLAQLPPHDVLLLDLAPGAAADLLGDQLPSRVRRAYRRWQHGPAVFTVHLAVEGGVPWTAEHCRSAGTVHLGGTLEEIRHSEEQIARGAMPERPFVLLAQQYLADPGRSHGDLHPVDAYAHVPHGYDGDATEAVLRQIERFAPGVRDRVVAVSAGSTAELARGNPNFVGGDILTGANSPLQVVLRPRLAPDPYRTGVPGVFLCSAATPPGAGVHGMCGHQAARSALRHLGAGVGAGAGADVGVDAGGAP
ncbi:phytoene desaturase family protein [Streptomyces sp. NPDC049040]|uniref:phytoene desaturase family protein n=1 Tax=Streptomyces sp. NPDC049040 TaxID=3365593 RepID=UPI0037185A73